MKKMIEDWKYMDRFQRTLVVMMIVLVVVIVILITMTIVKAMNETMFTENNNFVENEVLRQTIRRLTM